jgi:hypothetical protein
MDAELFHATIWTDGELTDATLDLDSWIGLNGWVLGDKNFQFLNLREDLK